MLLLRDGCRLEGFVMWMQNLEFGIDCDSRVALVGPNGAGTHISPCRSASMTHSALMCGTGSCELYHASQDGSLPLCLQSSLLDQTASPALKLIRAAPTQRECEDVAMLDAADIPHEGSTVMAESAWLAAAKSMLQKLMFKDLSFRHRHKHLQIVRGNITQSTCCREEHAAEADVRGPIPHARRHQAPQPPGHWALPPALCGHPG